MLNKRWKYKNFNMGDVDQEQPEKNDSADESEDEGEVLEYSPCGRWQKRREEVEQRDVPGIDYAFLAMDTEEGVEVVWNEVQFSENRNLKAQEDKIRQVFDNLIQLDHPNIVKFHKYWTDTKDGKSRVIFITEYMSSGSLSQFMKKTRKNNKTFNLKAWKRWCTQILSALSYLHSCNPPITHGNLACDTIFIQHNGLIKIGSVAPDAMHHVKTYRKDIKNMHCIAPEYADPGAFGPPIDIYSFGICALEIAALGFQGNGGESSVHVTEENIKRTLESLENPLQRDFISQCIIKDPADRPNARELLFHAILFEVHSLKLLAAHTFVKSLSILPENLTDEAFIKRIDPNTVFAEIWCKEPVQWKRSQVPNLELEKFLEDVRNGIYPLTAFTMQDPPTKTRPVTPEVDNPQKSEDQNSLDVENRLVTSSSCNVRKDDSSKYHITLMLKMDDKMNRQLTADFSKDDNADILAQELVHYGFINKSDEELIAKLINDQLMTVLQKTNIPVEGS
ncbi:nuclear receptor-binding protein [Mytilus galloprovincialis]|uniref:Nuclear receptor-binding protein homolog n=2 Tax=Mytilus galloprovincialis TaxID=29158 RepID=A0A8B6HN04_MYTGA|nr:nuclear receptor-binding protein [Mytilus galloprovincialis]